MHITKLLIVFFLFFSSSHAVFAEENKSVVNEGSDDYLISNNIEINNNNNNNGTYVSGQISKDETWVKEGGPYYVTSLFVPFGVTLTVEDGVEIILSDYLVIEGSFITKGESDNHVIISSSKEGVPGTMTLISGSDASVSFTDFEGVQGITVINSNLDVNNVAYKNSAEGILLVDGSKLKSNTLSISSLLNVAIQLVDSTGSIKGGSIEASPNNSRYVVESIRSNLSINDVTLTPIHGGAMLIVGGTLDILNAFILNGLRNGIDIFPDQSQGYQSAQINMASTTIKDFKGSAILAVDPELVIDNSVIENNAVGIEAFAREDSSILMRSSSIAGNEDGIIYGVTDASTTASFIAIGNWWGSQSGPYELNTNPLGLGDSITNFNTLSSTAVIFDPWSGLTKKRNPVIIIPGIMGSYLNEKVDNQKEIWPNITKLLLSGDDDYLDKLILDQNGIPDPNQPIFANDIVREINVLGNKVDFFTHLIDRLIADGYEEGVDLFVSPYDWRLDIADPNGLAMSSLKKVIEEALAKSSADKVDIIAHSMGGLLAKAYMQNDSIKKVDKFIDVASPHLGSPSAMKTLVYGDNLGIKFAFLEANPLQVKKISQNMPSVYQLLPSKKYFSTSTTDYKYYIADIADADSDEVKGKLDHKQSMGFLENTGRNSLLLDRAQMVHDNLDDFNPAVNGVATYNIVGCGTPTIGQIYTVPSKDPTDSHYAILYINGDGTVPQRSAEYLQTNDVFYANNISHSTMPSDAGISNLIVSILNDDIVNFSYTSNLNIARSEVNCGLPDGKVVEVHSPVDLHVYDMEGNHTGPNADGDIEYGVSEVVYDVIDGNKFAFLPNDKEYSVRLIATASGTFDAHIKTYESGEVISTVYFADVPLVGTQTRGEIIYNKSLITLDLNGVGDTKEIMPTAIIPYDDILDTVELPLSEGVSEFLVAESGQNTGSTGFDSLVAPQVLGISDMGSTTSESVTLQVGELIKANSVSENFNYSKGLPDEIAADYFIYDYRVKKEERGIISLFIQFLHTKIWQILITFLTNI